MVNKKIIIASLMVLTGGILFAQNAAEIVEKSRNRIQAETTSTRSRMVITARNGTSSERLMDQYSKDDAQGNHRTVVVFQSPASVAGPGS